MPANLRIDITFYESSEEEQNKLNFSHKSLDECGKMQSLVFLLPQFYLIRTQSLSIH